MVGEGGGGDGQGEGRGKGGELAEEVAKEVLEGGGQGGGRGVKKVSGGAFPFFFSNYVFYSWSTRDRMI